jgi:glycosyltransferase involved in cell wall biosynthesis
MTYMSSSASTPRLTVIIPTRERCDTLEKTLLTVVTQDYEHLEIIVSDNFSQDRTRDVVASHQDKRIHYVNTGKRLSMSDNYEFALSHVTGDYVMLLGDDDGLLPGAIGSLAELFKKTNADAIGWLAGLYYWPSCLEQHARNELTMHFGHGGVKVDPRERLRRVLDFEAQYLTLPCVYTCGIVKYATLCRLKEASGRFIHSMIPDVYLGIALGCTVDSFYVSKQSFSLFGLSHNSGGSSLLSSKEKQGMAAKFLSEDNLPFYFECGYIPSIPVLNAESYYQVRAHIPSAPDIPIDARRLIESAIREARLSNIDLYGKVATGLQSIGEQLGIGPAAAQIIARYPHLSYAPPRRPAGINGIRRYIRVDCADFGIRDIYQASLLGHAMAVAQQQGHYKCWNMVRSTLSNYLYARKEKRLQQSGA